jgi:hypothetical protein
MMNKKLILVMLITVFLIGCRTAPVMDVTDVPINTPSGTAPSMSAVTKGIINAGIQKGWQMKKQRPGHIIGTLYLRKHMVKVDIKFNAQEYSITYNDSSNMQYDGENIHSNYNSWVQNLSNAIQTNVYNNPQ